MKKEDHFTRSLSDPSAAVKNKVSNYINFLERILKY